MFGYDAARLHAALNDLPPVLLSISVLFDLLGALLKRESLKAAGFWTLVFGVAGSGVAIISGLVAQDATAHGVEAHGLMETHETLAYIAVGLFAILAIWRLVRKGVWNEKEQPIALTAGVIGVALIVVTAMFGGKLVFEHGVGIPTPALQSALQDRAAAAAAERVPVSAAPPAAQPVPGDTAPPAARPDTAQRDDDER
jgi:uncharacterized membrane protein